MKTKMGVKIIVYAICFSIAGIIQTGQAFAWSSRDRHSHHIDSPRRIERLPKSHTTIVVSGLPYYYYGGYFYRQGPTKYVYVNAPLGAVVPVPPPACDIVVINGMTYYSYDNVYYVQQGNGYVVVPRPVFTSVPRQPITTSTDTVVINVPNSNGSYTPVILKKSGESYIGPQGEYYITNPTVDQLKVLYAK